MGQMAASVSSGSVSTDVSSRACISDETVSSEKTGAQGTAEASWYRTESLYEPLDTANRYIDCPAGQGSAIGQGASGVQEASDGEGLSAASQRGSMYS